MFVRYVFLVTRVRCDLEEVDLVITLQLHNRLLHSLGSTIAEPVAARFSPAILGHHFGDLNFEKVFYRMFLFVNVFGNALLHPRENERE